MSKIIWNIKNILQWLPVLWNNFDWDYGFLYNIVLHKLKNMEKFFNSEDACATDASETAKQIQYVIERLDRISNYSHAEYLKDADKDWKTMTESELDELFDKADKLEEQDHQEMFDYMRDNIRSWWE